MISQGEKVASTFLYRGHASALGGALRRPVVQNINTNASSVLTHAGGYHSSPPIRDYTLENIISFRSATTEISGSQQADGSYTSYATATIEGLNIYNQVTADRIVGQLSSVQRADGSEPDMFATGSQFYGLRVGGVLVEPLISHDLHSKLSSLSKLTSAWDDKGNDDHPKLRAAARQWYMTPKDADAAGDAVIPMMRKTRDGMVHCSLCTGFVNEPRHVDRSGFQITVPNFGTIYLAELFVGKDTRRLNMLRIHMGSPVEGDAVLANLDLNGVIYP